MFALPARADITLAGTVRDLEHCPAVKAPHCNVDFENVIADDRGMVSKTLGSDGTPVYLGGDTGTSTTHGNFYYDQWYHDRPGYNIPVPVSITLTAALDGSLNYNNGNFFPIDTQGWADPSFGVNPQIDSGHNFSFTYQLHAVFTYHGGETFNFCGDDDVWVFVNQQLIVDLGGVHGTECQSFDLTTGASTLGLVVGNNYTFDFFSAERHTTGSDIAIQTTIALRVPPPTVSIGANPSTITLGQSTALSYFSTNADSCNASGDWSGAKDPGAGTHVENVMPAAAGTASYKLTCTGAGGTATSSVTVTVKPSSSSSTVTIALAPGPGGGASAPPGTIFLGDNATLSWSSTNATACTASDSWSGSQATNGSFEVHPGATGTYTYTLTCSGAGSSASSSVTLTVKPAPAPAVVISVTPNTITVGQSAALTWSSAYAKSCTASWPGGGADGTNGTMTVQPNAAGTAIYTLTCAGVGGTTSQSATLAVASAGSGEAGAGGGGGSLGLGSLLILFMGSAGRRIRVWRQRRD